MSQALPTEADLIVGTEPTESFNRIALARALVLVRDAGNIQPWEKLSSGFGTQTWGRTVRGNDEEVLMVVGGKRYAVGWAVASVTANPSVVFAAGVLRFAAADENYAKAADENYAKAMVLADAALEAINPRDEDTMTAVLSDKDESLLRHLDFLNEDTFL